MFCLPSIKTMKRPTDEYCSRGKSSTHRQKPYLETMFRSPSINTMKSPTDAYCTTRGSALMNGHMSTCPNMDWNRYTALRGHEENALYDAPQRACTRPANPPAYSSVYDSEKERRTSRRTTRNARMSKTTSMRRETSGPNMLKEVKNQRPRRQIKRAETADTTLVAATRLGETGPRPSEPR
jgi:hypothetical protein